MSEVYIPLYRKYRPQKFSDFVGQETVVSALSNAINLGKVSHAYLFCGPRGTGKTSGARILAKALNCQKGPTPEPCGVCDSCVDITSGSAVDVIEIDAASNRKVEDARNLLEKVQFVPVSGKYKIYIIDEVHMLTTEAFNTLLKTLEEPPKNLVFILATTEPHKVLNTIISRCQRYDFRRIKNADIKDRLKNIAQKENINISDNALALIARKSFGGLRDALGLLDQSAVLGLSGDLIDDKQILNLLGSISEDALVQLVETITNKNAEALVKTLNDIIQLGNEPQSVLRELIGYFRNMLVAKSASKFEQVEDLIEASEYIFGDLKRQSQMFEIVEIAQIIDKLAETEKQIKTTNSQYLWLEVALISICHRHEIAHLSALENRISELEARISGGNISVSQQTAQIAPPIKKTEPVHQPQQVETPKIDPQPTQQIHTEKVQQIEPPVAPKTAVVDTPPAIEQASPVTVSSQVSGNLDKNWSTLLEKVASMPSRMFFMNLAKPVEVSAERIVITFDQETLVKQVQETGKLPPLEKAAEQLFGKLPKVIIRTPMADDEIIRKNSSQAEVSQKKNVAPISIVEEKPVLPQEPPKHMEQVIAEAKKNINVKNVEAVNADIESESSGNENIARNISLIGLSDSTKMVIDLFNGKIINES